jgi:5-formyltetrahydrofolate cyclo-ligase
MTTDKKSLRAQSLAARESITPDAARTASVAVAKHLVDLIPAPATIIAGYRAVRGEIDVFETMAQLSERGQELCLPVMAAPHAPLIFRRWRIGHPLEIGQYGIEIPPTTEPELIPDTVIVPLVAFDKKGHRLGYGAGFYDATIHQLRQSSKTVQIIGVAFAAQQVDVIPVEPHDAKLDAVVTEKEIVIPA